MAVKLSPVLNSQIFDANGNPLIGGTIETYLAGSSIPFNTFVSSDGLTPQTNPIVLNALGQTANLIWLQSGAFYKFIVKDSLGNVQNTLDNIQGVNELIINLDQWILSDIVPTYINATTFTLAGDQTSVYQISRRLKLSVTAGTLYGTVLSAVYGASTTVTVKLDSGALDAGLSSLSYGILTPDNSSFPSIIEDTRQTIVATATTTPLWDAVGKIQDWTGTPTITNLPNAPQAGSQRITYPAAGTIITDNANISVQGNATYTVAAGDELTITAITTTTFYVTIDRKDGQSVGFKQIQPITASVGASALTVTLNPTSLDFRDATLTSGTVNSRTVSSAISLVVPSGATLGTISAQQSRLIALAIDNAGTIELAIVNLAGGNDLSETGVISTTALSTGSDSANVIYSTTARTNVPYRVVGFVDSTQATAGTWATAPSTIQGYGGQALTAMSSIGYGQTWQTVTRVTGTTYYNTTGKPIQVSFIPTTPINWAIGGYSMPCNSGVMVQSIIPPNASYLLQATSVGTWAELR